MINKVIINFYDKVYVKVKDKETFNIYEEKYDAQDILNIYFFKDKKKFYDMILKYFDKKMPTFNVKPNSIILCLDINIMYDTNCDIIMELPRN